MSNIGLYPIGAERFYKYERSTIFFSYSSCSRRQLRCGKVGSELLALDVHVWIDTIRVHQGPEMLLRLEELVQLPAQFSCLGIVLLGRLVYDFLDALQSKLHEQT